MADRHWTGGAIAVAQVETGSIDSVDGTPANNTFHVTIGNVAISAVGDTDVATTATNLRASLNASTHPYFNRITWSGTAGSIVGTADNAGEPFVAVLTETGAGTGTVTDFAETTANDGPNVFDTADNWREDTAPVNNDTVIFADNAIDCRWNLGTSLTGLTVYVDDSYTGEIGLNPDEVAITADGASTDTTAPEYRDAELSVDASTIEIGRQSTAVASTGSSLVAIHNSRGSASTCIVHSTATSAGRSAVEYSAAHANADVEVRGAQGGVGLCTRSTRPTGTFGVVEVSGISADILMSVADGCTVTTYRQAGGTSRVRTAATLTTCSITGGTATVDGSSAITTLSAAGGTVRLNGPITVTTANVTDSGTLDLSRSAESRTLTTLNQDDGTYIHGRNVTLTTHNVPSGTPDSGHTVVSTPP